MPETKDDLPVADIEHLNKMIGMQHTQLVAAQSRIKALLEELEALRGGVERERQRCYAIVLRAPYEQEELDASCWASPEVMVEVALKSMAFDITSKIRNGAAIGEKKE